MISSTTASKFITLTHASTCSVTNIKMPQTPLELPQHSIPDCQHSCVESHLSTSQGFLFIALLVSIHCFPGYHVFLLFYALI